MEKPNLPGIINFLSRFFYSFKNFVKSAILSIVIIVIILLLLTKMDQTLTLMVDLLEQNKFSLFLSFFLLNGLALVLSHYPIYTYYAANLNNSGDKFEWLPKKPYRFWPLRVFIYKRIENTNYTPDNLAHYLRYFLGITIYFVWIHYIVNSFIPKLNIAPSLLLNVAEFVFCLIPFGLYISVKEKITRLSKVTYSGDKNYENNEEERKEKLKKLLKNLGHWYTIVAILNVVLITFTLFSNFSRLGFSLMLLTSYAFMFNYVFFRLLRSKLGLVNESLKDSNNIFTKKFIELLCRLKKSEYYLFLFHVNFYIAFALILYSTYATYYLKEQPNGIPILLAFFYFYYFIIANFKKYFFVANKLNYFEKKEHKMYKNLFISMFFGLIIFSVLSIISIFFSGEVKTHQLEIVDKKTAISETEFLATLNKKQDSVLFFIASHGGGLKANVWTLKVINELQKRTKYKLLDNTIALSGASGGSLGLAVYTGLYAEHGKDTISIKNKIDKIANDDYVTGDLSLTLGTDLYRKLWPLQKIKYKDRSYFSMLKYQNHIESKTTYKLDTLPYRTYWKKAYLNNYFPSLIMNTASTKGKRGVFWSVKQNDFNAIFPFSDNLADINKDETLPFYQAVSTTNRFPFLSPAAKIPSFGHYIDAGAIDNSGLLSCIDLYNYLKNERLTGFIKQKKIVFIEIINSKTLYIKDLLEKYLKAKKQENLLINENEIDNIFADINTLMNLDKIPLYLSEQLKNLKKSKNDNVDIVQLYMPHKVTIDDVERFLVGRICEDREGLIKTLIAKNTYLFNVTEGTKKKFYEAWKTYEPNLSRHLSKSSINFNDGVLKHKELIEKFNKIESFLK